MGSPVFCPVPSVSRRPHERLRHAIADTHPANMNEQASAWLTAIEGLPAVHERLKRVVILNRDVLDVIRQQDGPDTLFYCDPPYLKETCASKDVYAHEMTDTQHLQLLELLNGIKGKFLLSGYPSGLYTTMPIHSAGIATTKRSTTNQPAANRNGK